MIRALALAALAAVSAVPACAQSTPTIKVSYPYDDPHAMPYTRGSFILGVATPTGGLLTINGSTVPQHTNGGFLAWVPVDPGTFTWRLEYAVGGSTAVFDRRLIVAKPLAAVPTGQQLTIDPDFTLPNSDVELRDGDFLFTQLKATPGKNAEFKVAGATPWLPMNESTKGSGLYQAALPVDASFKADKAEVRFRIREGFWKSVSHESKGKVTAPAPVRVVETSTDTVVLRSGPNRGYVLFPFKGTRFVADGRLGSQIRVRLSPNQSGWTGADTLKTLPSGALPAEAVLSTIRTATAGRETQVRLDLSESVPATVEEDGEWLRLTLYNTVGHVSWIVYDSSDTLVREIRWKQEDPKTAVVSIRRDPSAPLWGWRTSYTAGQLTLTLRRPPPLDPWGSKPMKGVSIVVDPGHSPGKQEGAVGPMGVWEADVAFSIAQQLKPMLEELGATVLLTREAGEEKSLYDRVRFAWEKRGDLVGSSRVDLQACKLEYSIVSPK